MTLGVMTLADIDEILAMPTIDALPPTGWRRSHRRSNKHSTTGSCLTDRALTWCAQIKARLTSDERLQLDYCLSGPADGAQTDPEATWAWERLRRVPLYCSAPANRTVQCRRVRISPGVPQPQLARRPDTPPSLPERSAGHRLGDRAPGWSIPRHEGQRPPAPHCRRLKGRG